MCNLARQPFFQHWVNSILREKHLLALEATFKKQRDSDPASLVELLPETLRNGLRVAA
jgi:hypothetical protein